MKLRISVLYSSVVSCMDGIFFSPHLLSKMLKIRIHKHRIAVLTPTLKKVFEGEYDITIIIDRTS